MSYKKTKIDFQVIQFDTKVKSDGWFYISFNYVGPGAAFINGLRTLKSGQTISFLAGYQREIFATDLEITYTTANADQRIEVVKLYYID